MNARAGLGVLLLLSAGVRADVFLLSDGCRIHGAVVREDEGAFRVRSELGEFEIGKSEVVCVLPGDGQPVMVSLTNGAEIEGYLARFGEDTLVIVSTDGSERVFLKHEVRALTGRVEIVSLPGGRTPLSSPPAVADPLPVPRPRRSFLAVGKWSSLGLAAASLATGIYCHYRYYEAGVEGNTIRREKYLTATDPEEISRYRGEYEAKYEERDRYLGWTWGMYGTSLCFTTTGSLLAWRGGSPRGAVEARLMPVPAGFAAVCTWRFFWRAGRLPAVIQK